MRVNSNLRLRERVSQIGVGRAIVKRLAAYAVLALLPAGFALMATTSEARAGGSVDALNVEVADGPLGDVESSPLSLSPSFAQTITDYVWRCQSGTNNIKLTLTAISGGTITIDGSTGTTLDIQESLIENQAVIISAPDPGNPNGHPIQYWIRCLPHDFPQLSVTKPGTPPPGWYLTGDNRAGGGGGTYAMVLDNNGTPVWYRKPARPGVFDVTQLADGTIAWASGSGGFGTDPNAAFEDFNLKTWK